MVDREHFNYGHLFISGSNIVDLSPLLTLTSVAYNLWLGGNTSLNSFCGLYPLLSSGGLGSSYSVANNLVNPTQQQLIDSGPCITSALVENKILPKDYNLYENDPNPFNPITTISYELPEQSTVSLTIFDVRGQEITTLQNAETPPGKYEVQWKGLDQQGNPVSTGVFFCRSDAGTLSQTIKMLYLKLTSPIK